MGYSPWGLKESDTTECPLTMQHTLHNCSILLIIFESLLNTDNIIFLIVIVHVIETVFLQLSLRR